MRGVFADLLGESGIVVQGRNNGRVRGTPRRRRPAWPSQFGDFEVSVPASGSDRGWPRGQTETVENLASGGRILNIGQNTHPAAKASERSRIGSGGWDVSALHTTRQSLGPRCEDSVTAG